MTPSFRRRIFWILVAMSGVPATLAVIGLVLAVSAGSPIAGARASLEQVGASARVMVQELDTLRLAPAERAAVRYHLQTVSQSLSLTRRAETYLRWYKAGFGAVIAVVGVMVVFTAVRLAGHLSRQLSRPIDELVGWTRLIRLREPLPAGPASRGAPEFQALRQALRELAAALVAARDRELEAERLRAFREVARRVAHEIKNPLTSMRIAVDQLARVGTGDPARSDAAVQVLVAETDRLERLAREFSEFGRLPEGPRSDVDLVELLEELGRTAVPDGVRVRLATNGAHPAVHGYYEPLRRAFANLLRNAAEAMNGRGQVDVTVTRGSGHLSIAIADHGPGIPEDLRGRVFEPYFTTKADGTGLGLALVRQAIEAHGGTVAVTGTPGGGATFTVTFPA